MHAPPSCYPATARVRRVRWQAGFYVTDSTSPTLVGFSLDLNALAVQLTFSEVVRSAGADPGEMYLQSYPASATGGTGSATRPAPLPSPQLWSLDLTSVSTLFF